MSGIYKVATFARSESLMDKGMQRYRVVASYDSASPTPITVHAGQRVRYERRDSEWDGWIWCTTASGITGWVPESWATLEGSHAVLRRDYCARELSVKPGSLVSGEIVESGWLWATQEQGDPGWVPLEVLEALDPDEGHG